MYIALVYIWKNNSNRFPPIAAGGAKCASECDAVGGEDN